MEEEAEEDVSGRSRSEFLVMLKGRLEYRWGFEGSDVGVLLASALSSPFLPTQLVRGQRSEERAVGTLLGGWWMLAVSCEAGSTATGTGGKCWLSRTGLAGPSSVVAVIFSAAQGPSSSSSTEGIERPNDGLVDAPLGGSTPRPAFDCGKPWGNVFDEAVDGAAEASTDTAYDLVTFGGGGGGGFFLMTRGGGGGGMAGCFDAALASHGQTSGTFFCAASGVVGVVVAAVMARGSGLRMSLRDPMSPGWRT